MRNVNYLNAEQRVDMTGLLHVNAKRQHILPPHLLTNSVSTAMLALERIDHIVADGSFAHPDKLTHDGILAYALALLKVRECAGMAGMERLMNACDALAVTVSRLIEDRASASPARCEALTQFVVHAQAMILSSTGKTAESARPPMSAKDMQIDAASQWKKASFAKHNQ